MMQNKQKAESLGHTMQKKSVIVFTVLFLVQAMAAGLAVIPAQPNTETWQGPVLESGARSTGVLTDSQQQSMLYNQSYNGNNDNDGDGVIDSLDSDDDNDCIPDSNDTSPYDFDGDGINDESDIDDDGDGLNDSLEVSDSNASTNIYDADNDGNHDCAFFAGGNSSSGNTGGNNTGGNNTGGNNTGGGNTSCNTTTGPFYNLTLDKLIYEPTDSINAAFNFFCMDYKAGIYTGVSYWVYGPSGMISSTFYVHNTSTNHNFWDLDNRSNNFSETSWLIPTGSGNMALGNYYIYSELWDNNTHVDTANVSFTVSNSSSGGNNTGCGYDTNFASLLAYGPNYGTENHTFVNSMYVQCEILNATMTLDYWIYDLNNNTIDSGNQSWVGTTNTSNYNWTVNGLNAGNYTFHVDLYVNNSWVTSDNHQFMILANNSGGNNTNEYVEIDHSGYAWETSNMVGVWYSGTDVYVEFTSGNLVIGENYQLIWNLSDSGNNVNVYGSGNFLWNASFTTSQENSTISGLADGIYYFHATLVNQGYHIAWDTTMIQMGNNTGGNNTGGNNTGGNNTGGNNTGGNNTGGNNTGGNNTGGNNTGGNNTGGNNTGGNNTGGNNSNPCGSDLNYSSILVAPFQQITPILYENDTFTGRYRPNCPPSDMNHSFTGHLQGPNASDYSNFSVDIYLAGGQLGIPFQYQSWSNLGVGMYSFYVEWNLNQSGAQTFVDEGWFNFTVIANNSNSPGSSQSNPLMPFNCSDINWNASGLTLQDCLNNQDAFWFVFNNTGGTFWIDPVVAIGYDYVVWSGPNIRSVTLPTGYGDDIYDLYMWNVTEWYDTGVNIDGGETYTFTEKFGVDRISIRGIEASEELDPNNATAFVTGLSFTSTNEVTMTMTPVTVNYTSNNTGGNNTGGNNTGGNNTGGNNTGGNNTGGNNTVTPNTAPSVTDVSISPVLTTADDELTCTYTVFDMDGDLTTTTVTWSVNGNIILTGSDSLTGGFSVGDDVSCSVTATDGQQPSIAASASTVILPVPNVDSDDGEGLPAIGTIGTMAAIAAGVFASRRKDD